MTSTKGGAIKMHIEIAQKCRQCLVQNGAHR
jgi:hypothetical protein